MNVALLNERIEIQKATVVSDNIGNRKNTWAPYFECACTIGGESGKEVASVAQTVEHTEISFTVRSCTLTDAVTSDYFRIVFKGAVYNIISVDHMNYKHKCLKFRCRKECK